MSSPATIGLLLARSESNHPPKLELLGSVYRPRDTRFTALQFGMSHRLWCAMSAVDPRVEFETSSFSLIELRQGRIMQLSSVDHPDAIAAATVPGVVAATENRLVKIGCELRQRLDNTQVTARMTRLKRVVLSTWALADLSVWIEWRKLSGGSESRYTISWHCQRPNDRP